MIENDLEKIVKAKTWTRQAVFCHSINCDCSKCDIFEEFKSKCQMRVSLLELIRRLGLPDEKTYNALSLSRRKF